MELLKQAQQLALTGACDGEIKPVTTKEVQALGTQLKVLHGIMRGPHVGMALVALQRAGFFEYLIPEIRDSLELKASLHFKKIWPHTIRVVSQTPPVTILRWAALFHDLGKARAFSVKNEKVTFHNHEKISANIFYKFARRSRIFNQNQRDRIHFLVENLGYVESYSSDWTDSAVRRFGKDIGTHVDDILILSSADITTSNKTKRQEILNSINELKERLRKIQEMDAKQNPLPKGLGNVIAKEFDLPFGPKIGNIKRELENRIASNELSSNEDIEYYIEYLKKNQVDFDLGNTDYSSIQLMG